MRTLILTALVCLTIAASYHVEPPAPTSRWLEDECLDGDYTDDMYCDCDGGYCMWMYQCSPGEDDDSGFCLCDDYCSWLYYE